MRILILGSFILFGVSCGYKDLPNLKEQAGAPFKELMIQYRLRADIAYNIAQIFKGEVSLRPEVDAVLASRSKALSIQLSLEMFNERDNNRFQSYQNFLGRDCEFLIRKAQNLSKQKISPVFFSQRDQWERVNQKLVRLKRDYLKVAKSFNTKKQEFPYSLYNKLKFGYQPLPDIGDLATANGGI
ncbi:MAG: LemA family protein [Bdellovibrionales bacterium]|nr:LemA family protein [Bdellovibrionales bacterium]